MAETQGKGMADILYIYRIRNNRKSVAEDKGKEEQKERKRND